MNRARTQISKKRFHGLHIALEIGMIIATLLFLYPIIFAIFTSLKSPRDFYKNPLWVPVEFVFSNYVVAWKEMNYPQAFFNSIVITVGALASILVVASLAAYPLARYRIRLNRILYVFFIVLLMVPYQTVMVPLVKQFYSLGLVNNYMSLIIYYTASAPGTPFAIFLLVGYMRTLPKELEEAAVMDGCTPIQIFVKIIVPLIKPALVTVLIIALMWIWNNFLMPKILLPSDKVMPLAPRIGRFFEEFSANWNFAFAGAVMTMIPGIAAYFFFQKYFIKGLASGAIK